MTSSTGMDDFTDKWEECTVQEKSLLIKAFIDEFGENATWKDWCAFLQRHNLEAIDWSNRD
jgi:hypothetical protein